MSKLHSSVSGCLMKVIDPTFYVGLQKTFRTLKILLNDNTYFLSVVTMTVFFSSKWTWTKSKLSIREEDKTSLSILFSEHVFLNIVGKLTQNLLTLHINLFQEEISCSLSYYFLPLPFIFFLICPGNIKKGKVVTQFFQSTEYKLEVKQRLSII